ncbi:MAG TPA: hypothetical protein VHU17_01795, partial [Acidimicrobiales bacterium]|nr:hypothetical protein [Acidimicrobiales bacterium]
MPTTKRGAIFVLLIATVLAAALASPAAEADPARTGSATTASATHFSTLLPGSSLPSDQTCAGSVRPVNEQRIDNVVMNDTVPPPGTIHLAPLDRENGYDNRAQTLEARVTGNFTGTTDEIIQWAACKWGFDENVVRAIAMTESDWHQDTLGDYTTNAASCPPGLVVPCPQSFGIHQVTWTSDPVGTWPWSQTSTAFNLDASLMVHRLCYEGYMQWLTDIGYTSYKAGDLWGCVGQWYSGTWHDSAAQSYIATVKNYVATAPWTQASFSNVPPPPPPTSLRYDFENGSTDGWYPAWGPVT